jgi:hypothetical protein
MVAAKGVIVTRTEVDVAGWSRARAVVYELGSLMEMVDGKQVQVGFTISLYARLPLEKPSGPARQAETVEIRERLREIVDSLAPPEGSRAAVDFEGPRAAVVFESGRADPEIVVTARVFHRADYFTEASLEEEIRFRRVTARLAEMGVEKRRPPLRW